MTEQNVNKVGASPDILTVVNENVIGSFVPGP
jgi:hypothetical protein